MAVAVSRALERGAPGIVCASTGNTAASAAAYAARAGLRAVVVTRRGSVARGKLAQARAVGVELREIEGTFDDAHLEARRLAEAEGLVNVNSINPDRIEGQTSAAREISSSSAASPTCSRSPTAAAATRWLRAGFRRDAAALPPRRGGAAAATTFATAIRIAAARAPRGGRRRARALRRADRVAVGGPARQARGARLRARRASSASPPAPPASRRSRRLGLRDVRVVCVVTGHGLKDPDAVEPDDRSSVRAPATTANLGPGFDCAGAALDLWNELELSTPATAPPDRGHLGVRAFERLAPADGWSFRFTDRSRRPAGSARAPP